jgi:putative transposase
VPLSFEGKNDTEISKELRVAYKTVRNRMQRVLDNGVKGGLKDKPGAGKPRKISEEPGLSIIIKHIHQRKPEVISIR